MRNSIEENKKLIEQFPFLLPRNRWTDKVPEDFDYSYTELDAMPDGWRIAFGIQMCEELKEILVKANALDAYRIVQIKEKYGTLRWYENGVPVDGYEGYHAWQRKYVELSRHTCIICGAKATKLSLGYYMPFCEKCAADAQYTGFTDIDY